MLRHRPNSIVSLGDGTEAYMELNADSTTDLATTYQGYDIAAGSICLDISTGDFYVLDGNGNWVNQTSENTVGTASVLSTAAIKKESLTYAPSELADKQEVNEGADILGDTDSDAE